MAADANRTMLGSMRLAILVLSFFLLASLPASGAARSASPSGVELPRTVCDKAEAKLKKAKRKVRKAKGKAAKRKAKKKLRKAKRQVGKRCLEVTSPAFNDGRAIPTQFTCDGTNVSPPLAWKGVKRSLPRGTSELALLVEDPDAPSGVFVHWVVYRVAPGTTSIAQNGVPPGALQGRSSFGVSSYLGPCPPPGDGPHRYFFTVFALSSPLGLVPNATAAEVRAAAQGETKAAGTLLGRYER